MPESRAKTYIATSFKNYLDIIELIKAKESTLWFRGQESASYRLLPSALRDGWEVANKFGEGFTPKPLGNNFHDRGTKVFLKITIK
nr:hypothetical protein [Bacillus cereus]